jgi:pimeloyl-ACP methyl ester carboxylesterase
MALSVGTDALLRQIAAIMGRPDSCATLAAIDCPTLVLCGEQDLLTPPVRHEEIAAGVQGSTLVKVPACGHLSTLENPLK